MEGVLLECPRAWERLLPPGIRPRLRKLVHDRLRQALMQRLRIGSLERQIVTLPQKTFGLLNKFFCIVAQK